MAISKYLVPTFFVALTSGVMALPATAATPSTCSISSLAGKWILFKSNMNSNQSSRCQITVSANGSFTGSNACNDFRWNYKSSAYSISGTIALSAAVNSCYVTINATAAGSVSIKAEGAINAGKDEISGFFTNSNPAVGPMSLIKVP